jgi:hypothetical protein
MSGLTLLLLCLLPVSLGVFLYATYLNIIVAQAVFGINRGKAVVAGLVSSLIVGLLIVGLVYILYLVRSGSL